MFAVCMYFVLCYLILSELSDNHHNYLRYRKGGRSVIFHKCITVLMSYPLIKLLFNQCIKETKQCSDKVIKCYYQSSFGNFILFRVANPLSQSHWRKICDDIAVFGLTHSEAI